MFSVTISTIKKSLTPKYGLIIWLMFVLVFAPFGSVREVEAATAWNNTDWPYRALVTVDNTKVETSTSYATTTNTYNSSTSFTVPDYTTLTVEVWGGGGGGGAVSTNNGATGGQSSFNGTVVANGGGGGGHSGSSAGAGGAGGTASGGDTNTTGTAGGVGYVGSPALGYGAGGAGANGGAGGAYANYNSPGNNGTAPGGAGSGGHLYYSYPCGKSLCYASRVGAGGGGGGYSKKTYSPGGLTPGASITVTVGAGGAGGAAGNQPGGAGAAGRVTVTYVTATNYINPENFPVYVDLSDMPSEFWTYVRSDCGDIRVISSDGAPEVPREVVTCNTGAHTGELWFKAPVLYSSNDTPFYIYYGNSSATDYGVTETYGANNVWTNGFKAVWHLKDGTTLSGTDSSGNSNTATASGASATSGNIDGGANFNGTTDYMQATHSTSLNISQPITLSAWVYLDTYGGASQQYIRGIVSKYMNASGNEYFLRVGSNGTSGGASYLSFGGGTDMAETTSFPTVQWVYVTGTADSSGNASLYRNGSTVKTGTVSISTGTDNLRIGQDYSSGGNARVWDGKIDEVRVSNVARSGGWITTEYNNQSSPSTFYSISSFTDPSRSIRLLGNVRLRGVRLR